MATRSTIKAQLYRILNETSSDTHISDDDANDFIDQSVERIATDISYPRKYDSGTSVVAGTAAYALPSDFLNLISAFYGDKTTLNDLTILKVMKEEQLKYLVPSYLQTHSSSYGRPDKLILRDKATMLVNPTPSAEEVTASRKIWLYYVYKPAALASDSAEPSEIPSSYHNCIQFYAAHLSYLKLENPNMSAAMMNKFLEEVKAKSMLIESESKEGLRFQWGYYPD